MFVVSDFLKLKEYDSLCRERISLQQKLGDEVSRLKRRESELFDREKMLADDRTQLSLLNREVADIDHQLKQRLSDIAKQNLEEKGLEKLILQQELELKIEEHHSFLAGFKATLSDITIEVNQIISQLKNQIKNLEGRHNLLFAELPIDWQNLYNKTALKNHAFGPFTRIENQQCKFCRFSVSKQLESEVDSLLSLRSCPGCHRIILPYKAVSA